MCYSCSLIASCIASIFLSDIIGLIAFLGFGGVLLVEPGIAYQNATDEYPSRFHLLRISTPGEASISNVNFLLKGIASRVLILEQMLKPLELFSFVEPTEFEPKGIEKVSFLVGFTPPAHP